MPRSPRAVARKARRNDRRVPTPQIAEEDAYARPSRARMEPVEPLNAAQKRYDTAIKQNRIIFGVGPAGTGKTWFAAMRAAEALEAKKITKIYLTRPAVEAGENLGFMPGELKDKYEPYIRPFRDAFEEKFGRGHFEYLIKAGVIEARPLAFLRGSTLKDCIVLLDEAQNLTPTQMKMFLTRIGHDAKFIITGDPLQKDIAGICGLTDGMNVTRDIGNVVVVRFTTEDVVRDSLCQQIVSAYER